MFALTASPGRRGHRGQHRDRPDEREGERDEQLDRDADDPRALAVVGDRAQRAPVARALEEPGRAERERDRQPGDEEGARLHLRSAEVDVPGRADAVERQRVREDVARALEGRPDHGADRKGDGRGPGDPADRRAAAQVRLDEPDVGRRPGEHADREPDQDREQKARLVRAGLAHRRGAGQDEQRREDPEPDQVAEGEVDDPGQPVDQRVPGREQPVDPARGEPGDDDLKGDRHGRTLSVPRDGCGERPRPTLTHRAALPSLDGSSRHSLAVRFTAGDAGGAGRGADGRVGDVLFRVGDATYPFIAIQEGEVAILDAAGNEIVRHGASSFLGELNLLSGQTVFLTALVTEPLRYIAVERDALRELLFDDGPLSDLVLSTFIARREALETVEGIGLEIVGPRSSEATMQMLAFVRANRLPFSWQDAEPQDGAEPPLVRLPAASSCSTRRAASCCARSASAASSSRARRSTCSSSAPARPVLPPRSTAPPRASTR